ncbi:MAG TPA: O-antigen ligase family protein [Solirubrobacteraceae bacterium]
MNVQAQRLPSTRSLGVLGALAGGLGAGILIGTLGGSPLLAFAGVLVIFCAVVAIVRQDLVVLAVVFLIYSDAAVIAIEHQGLPFALGAAVPLLLAIPLAYEFLQGRRPFIDPLSVALAVLLLAMLQSGLLARDSHAALDGIRTFALQGVVLYILVVNVLRSQATLRLAMWSVLTAGAFLAAVTVFQYVTKTFERPYLGFSALDIAYFTGQSSQPRASGPVADPNYYAQILLPALAFGLLAVLREPRTRLRLLGGAMAATILFAITLTGSRGGAIALVAMFLVMIALRLFKPGQLLAVLAVGAVALALNPSYVERLTGTSLSGIAAPAGSAVAADIAARGRLTENLAALQVFADHPVFGVGPGGFPLYYQEYASRIGIQVHTRERGGLQAGQAPQRAAHNIALGLAADLGVVGLAFFGVVVWIAFAGLLRARRHWLSQRRPDLADVAGALVLALTGYLVAGVFLSLAYERYLWLLLAMAGAAIALSRTRRGAHG